MLIRSIILITIQKPDNRLLQQTIELEKKNKVIETAKDGGSSTETAG